MRRHLRGRPRRPADPLQRDLLAGRRARRASAASSPRSPRATTWSWRSRWSRRRWPRRASALERDRGGRGDRRAGADRRPAGRRQHREGDRRAAPPAADPGRPPAGPRRRQLPRARAAGAALPLPGRERRPHAAGRGPRSRAATRCSARRSTTPPARPSTRSARMLGLGYPGGPALERLAAEGDPRRFELPVAMSRDPGLDFSFSGLKTALVYLCRDLGPEGVARAPRRPRRRLPGGRRRPADRQARAGAEARRVAGGRARRRRRRQRPAARSGRRALRARRGCG